MTLNDKMMMNPWTQIGLGILGANRPGASFGQAVGTGGLLGLRNYQEMVQAQQMQEYRQAQMEAEQRALEQEAAERERMNAARALMAEKFPDIAPVLEAYPSAASQVLGAQYRAPTEAPSSVREWQYFTSLPPDQRQQYLSMKRSGQQMDLGNVVQYRTPGGQIEIYGKGLAPQDTPMVKGQQAEESAAGQARGKATAEASIGLEQAISEAQNSMSLIDKMINHPGLEYAVGTSSVLPIVPGTAAADFDALAKQMEGKAFLQAFETLKGGGQITEIEGKKATAAMARLSRSQTEGEYKSSLLELKNILQDGMMKAKAKAKLGGPNKSTSSDGWSIRLVE